MVITFVTTKGDDTNERLPGTINKKNVSAVIACTMDIDTAPTANDARDIQIQPGVVI